MPRLISQNSFKSVRKNPPKLNPFRRPREPLGVGGIRQSVVVIKNPSTINQNHQLLVWFPNLGARYVIVPGTAQLAFTATLNSTDASKTVVSNLGLATVKETPIKISGNEAMSIDDIDVFQCYQDHWTTAIQTENAHYQGIDIMTN